MNKITELQKLEKKILSKLDCSLKSSAKSLVFGKGNVDAKIFFIGEAPGAKEDERGIPFVGKAGKILDELLQSIGLGIDDVYIANILKYRPPKNRNPTKEEILSHTPYLLEQIQIINPDVIIPLGNFATKYVLNKFSVKDMNKISGITQLHGKVFEVALESKTFLVIPCFHPAATIYNQKLREDIVKDFIFIKKHITSNISFTNSNKHYT